MALTYDWQRAADMASKLCKGLNISSIDETVADMVSSEAWSKYPWFMSQQNIASGILPCVDGQQDYSAPVNIFRLLDARLVRTDTTPDDHRDLDVQQFLSVDLVSRSPYSIRCIAHQSETGGLRLESAVQISSGATWEIQGTYQTHPSKVTSLASGLWFHDEHFMVAVEGMLYWMYRLGDDSRAGSAVIDPKSGRTNYSGQLAVFHSAIDKMWAAEELQGTESIVPETPLGVSASSHDMRGIFS